MTERKHYIDNIRWIVVLIVIVYHTIYLFNNSGVVSNIGVKGVPELDALLIFVYPWFMCLLFVVAGMSSRYSLTKRTNGQFIGDRAKRILVPSIVGIFAYSWITGFVTSRYTGMFEGEGAMIPAFVKWIICCFMGIGPLWFAHVIFIASVLLVIVRTIDKKDKIWSLGEKANLPFLLVMTAVVWGSSFLLNVPIISVYRFGIYLLMFFMGYFVFSHDEVLDKLKKAAVPMGIIALAGGIAYTIYYYGSNYTEDGCLQSIFTNAYLWVAILAILGLGQKFLNFENKFSRYMTENNFSYYVLHYPVVVGLGYLTVTYLDLPFICYYPIILAGTAVVLPIAVAVLKRIPVVNMLVLGVYKKKSKKKTEEDL